MKKLIIVILFAFLSMGFTLYVPDNDSFMDGYLEHWMEVRNTLLSRDIEIEGVLGTQKCYAKPGSEYITVAYFEEGVIYGQIGYSDFANIQLCYAPNLDRGNIWREKKWICSETIKGLNNKPFLGIEVKETGQYLLKIKTLKGSAGIHKSNVVYMYRKGKNDKIPQLRQDQYYDIYGTGVNQR